MKGIVAFTATFALAAELPAAVRADDSIETKDRPAQKAIRELAAATVVGVGNTSETARRAKLQPQPVLSYGDETRDIKDSALWVWFDNERPVLFEKIEVNDWSPAHPQWTFCLASFSESPLEVTMNGPVRRQIQTTEATFFPLPDAPTAAKNPAQWPLQVRQLARRFRVETYTGEERTELRLLPKPLVEFRPESQPTVYGAVFGYARGTNPDVLIQIRLHESPSSEMNWSCSIAQMTSERIVVRHEEQTIAEPPPQKAGEISYWGYFFTPRDPAIR